MRLSTCALTVAVATAFVPSVPLRRRSVSTTTNLEAQCDVAIFGGGFGGLYTALALAREARIRRRTLDVVLVDDSDSFVFLPLLYDLTVGTATEAEVCPKYNDLLQGTGVRHVKASLDSLETDKRAILMDTKEPLDFDACVVSVGASPKAILNTVPGASKYAQPFYTQQDAAATQHLLKRLETQKLQEPLQKQYIAVVGGGFGGVELAAAVKRRIPTATVKLLSRGAPMAGTRAEPLVDKVLHKLGVIVEQCSVKAIREASQDKLIVERNDDPVPDDTLWDAVLWTAGSAPAYPVAEGLDMLLKTGSGRLATDQALRCLWNSDKSTSPDPKPSIWALGDCAEIARTTDQPAVPRTAQAAMQQADVVANNLLNQLDAPTGKIAPGSYFSYQDLGSMLMLGGPNAAVMAPRQGPFDAIFAPVLDTMGEILNVADQVVSNVGQSSLVEKLGLTSPEMLGLSLGSHGLGVDSGDAPGTLAGTLTGAARRAVYAARMPTNRQRAVSVFSAAISTATALAKEAAEQSKK